MAKTRHQHFGDDDNEIDEQLSVAVDTLQNIDSEPSSSSRRSGKPVNGNMSSSDESDDDDAAPEAIQASSAKSIERARLSKLQSAAKQAKQKKEAATKKQKKSPAANATDRKGKGKAIQEDASVLEEDDANVLDSADVAAQDEARSTIAHVPVTIRRKHQVFNDEDDESRPSSSAPRLDPALFQQADLALQQAKERALQEQRQQRQEAALAAEEGRTSPTRGKKRTRPEAKTSRIVGDVVVQQLALESKTGEANIDASTALTSKYNENFLKDRLFKRKKARLTKSNNNAVNGGKKEEKPFLLFDPLLDKAPKKKAEAKPLTRAEMEERLRFRKSAQTAFSKTQRRSMGPSVAFGSAPARRTK